MQTKHNQRTGAFGEEAVTQYLIEHNAEIIKSADWIIDLGPDGGNNGGKLTFEGTPEQIILDPNSFTGEFLKTKLVTT